MNCLFLSSFVRFLVIPSPGSGNDGGQDGESENEERVGRFVPEVQPHFDNTSRRNEGEEGPGGPVHLYATNTRHSFSLLAPFTIELTLSLMVRGKETRRIHTRVQSRPGSPSTLTRLAHLRRNVGSSAPSLSSV